MSSVCRVLIIFSALWTFILPAYAHVGHLGELAGHSHWIGLGAVVVAGALAGIVGKLSDKNTESDDAENSEEDEIIEGEPA